MSKITGLYYITHIDNLASILQYGILSHQEIETRGIAFHKIYDEQIVSRRQQRLTLQNQNLWHYANLYFQPRNPMLYRIVSEAGQLDEIVVIRLKKQVLELPDILIADGNAAHSKSGIYPYQSKLLKNIQSHLELEYWKEIDGTKRKIMAECLIPKHVPVELIECIYVARPNGILATVKNILQKQVRYSIEVVAEPKMFFLPEQRIRLNQQLSLVRGDLFFSRMQTLTISVNTVGVMGKGLASRAKYQFPEVYVRYQDLCKSKRLKVGLPALIKTEMSLLAEFSENSVGNGTENWFLLFPTKQHWRENSKLEYLQTGLEWLMKNYQTAGIESLALPALGCGLGNLSWGEVGKLMCRRLREIEIPVCIYLPAEQKIRPEQLTAEYLLS